MRDSLDLLDIAENIGANATLSKPFTPKELLDLIKTYRDKYKMDITEKRILIVDDTPTNIKVLIPILMDHGKFQINIANNGVDALKLLEKIVPDLILLDIMMPEMDGFETCKRIKETEHLKDIPIIFLTAKNETEDLAKGFGLGAADFVCKPFNSVELIARVKNSP